MIVWSGAEVGTYLGTLFKKKLGIFLWLLMGIEETVLKIKLNSLFSL